MPTAETANVVEWLFSPDSAELEPDVELAARRLLLDTLGCMIGGASKPELEALGASLARFEAGSVRLPGLPHSLTPQAAAYWSAMAATWDEACEGLARAHGRPGLHSFPVAVALTLATNGTLGDALVALVRGYELAGRLGERLRIVDGMHVDGTWGTFGGVAAAGSVLGCPADTVMSAVEAAACQTPVSLYLPVAQGATIRNSYVAESARRAIGLVTAVESGVTVPVGALDVFDTLALGNKGEAATLAPPGEWLITQGYLKPFAAVRHVHYGAEAASQWLAGGEKAADITDLHVDVYPEAITYCGNRAPDTAIAAQFSLTYGIARMLTGGDLGPKSYTTEVLADPELRRLEQLLTVAGQSATDPDQRYAELRITTAAGDRSIRVERVVGDTDNPMSTDQVVAKFRSYAGWLAGDWSAEAVADKVLHGSLKMSLTETFD